jgi:hypothetical protein
MNTFTHEGIAEYSCTAESVSMEKEETLKSQQSWTRTRDNLDWTKFSYRSHVIRLPYQAKDFESVTHGSRRR